MQRLDEELSGKVYLDGDGMKLGPRDKETFEKIKNMKVCEHHLKNLSRWLKFIRSQLE